MAIHTRRLAVAIAVTAVVTITAAGSAAMAGGNDQHRGERTLRAQLTGYEEDPLTISTSGTGRFRATIDERDRKITYRLSYGRLEGTVTQSHIHFGGKAQSGGISVFLCSNLGNGPAGTQACPAGPATVSGTNRPDDVIGPTDQGIDPGEFAELIAAIRAGTTYVNVHSDLYPAGEIRAQLDHHHHH